MFVKIVVKQFRKKLPEYRMGEKKSDPFVQMGRDQTFFSAAKLVLREPTSSFGRKGFVS